MSGEIPVWKIRPSLTTSKEGLKTLNILNKQQGLNSSEACQFETATDLHDPCLLKFFFWEAKNIQIPMKRTGIELQPAMPEDLMHLSG